MARLALIVSGLALLLGAAMHVAALWLDPAYTAFLGAPPEIVDSVRDGTWPATAAIAAIAAILVGIAAAAFSVAGVLPRLPGARWVVGIAGVLFALRGLIVAPYLATGRVNWGAPYDVFHVGLSVALIVLGVAMVFGAVQHRR